MTEETHNSSEAEGFIILASDAKKAADAACRKKDNVILTNISKRISLESEKGNYKISIDGNVSDYVINVLKSRGFVLDSDADYEPEEAPNLIVKWGDD
jgi:hypothetical protein